MDEVKSCPFCGGEDTYCFEEHQWWVVCCVECGVNGPTGQTEEEAVESWNIRLGK